MTSPETSITPKQMILAGMDAAKKGDIGKALEIYQHVVEANPENAAVHNEIGVALYQSGRVAEAKEWFKKAVKLKQGFARALTNLGACYNEEKDNENAIRCYREALKTAPDMIDAWGNMAKAWTESEEFEMAVYCYRKAIEMDPRVEYDRGLAKAYRKSGRYDRSEQVLTNALRKNPNDPDAHFGLALTLFHLEKYPEAIREFEWRRKIKEMIQHARDLHPIFALPEYNGEDLSDKTLLLHTEQGFGDNLQFARFISLVRPKAKRLVMWCRPGLGKLFQESFGLDAVSENVFQLPKADYQLPLLSVPVHFDPDLNSLNRFTPYLFPPGENRPYLDIGPQQLNVGLVWGASDSGFDHGNKKVPLTTLAPLFDVPGVRWFSLQVGSDRDDMKLHPGTAMVDAGRQLKDFVDTAHAVSQLDLVISCDTSVAHLAGGMGKPLWVMLKKNPDWRWHSDGESTLWYPSARLFRQDSHGDWSSVIRRIKANLTKLSASTSANAGI